MTPTNKELPKKYPENWAINALLRVGRKWTKKELDIITEEIEDYHQLHLKDFAERVLKNASGGGNWRRVIQQELLKEDRDG